MSWVKTDAVYTFLLKIAEGAAFGTAKTKHVDFRVRTSFKAPPMGAAYGPSNFQRRGGLSHLSSCCATVGRRRLRLLLRGAGCHDGSQPAVH
jgi:hypothetical protein